MPRTLLCLSCNLRFEPDVADEYDTNCPRCGTPLVAAPPWSEAPLVLNVPPRPPPTRPVGNVSCRYCGKTVPAACVFCPFCEKPLAQPREEQAVYWPKRRTLRAGLTVMGLMTLVVWGVWGLAVLVKHGEPTLFAALGLLLSVLFVIGLVGYSTNERWHNLGLGPVIVRLLVVVGIFTAVGCGCLTAGAIFLLIICMGSRW